MNNLLTFDEYLYEGLWGKTINRSKSGEKRKEDKYIIDDIRAWMKTCVEHISYNLYGVDKELTKKLGIKSYWVIFKESPTFEKDIPDNVTIKDITGTRHTFGRYALINATGLTTLKKLPKKLGTDVVDRKFNLKINLNNIKDSQIIFPENVGLLSISKNDDTTRLPKEINFSIYLYNNKQFNHIEKVDGDFYCANTDVSSLIGCPKIITGDFDAHNCNIKDLTGCPEHVKNFSCSNNDNLKSLKGCGNMVVDGNFYFYSTSITNIDEFPKHVNGDVELSGCPYLNSFEGLPDTINGDLDISHCNVKSLKGLPTNIKGNLYINKLTLNNKPVMSYDIKNIYPTIKNIKESKW